MADRRREVQELREGIARLDAELCERLDARARLSSQIRALSEVEPVADGGEAEWLDKVVSGSSGDLPGDSMRAIFREIRAAGRALEQPARVAIVGPEGGFCYQSALEAFGATTQTVESSSAADALSEVIRSRAAFAMIPFESSAEGFSQPSLMALADTDLALVGERFASATYNLMSLGSDKAQLEKVYMTAAAHAACQRFLDTELPHATIIDVRSPRVAAELAKEAASSGAVVPERAGRSVGLEVLRPNVGDAAEARKRYGIAGQRPAPRSGHDISCLLFSTDNQPGSLYDTLRHFAERGINLRKLQSLPSRREGFEYVFYVEINGHASDRAVVTAFEGIKRSVAYFRLLGSFPTAG
ncbi:MAG: prephenate dehydratase domain-containing protein [Polyangiaceae bacterium]